MPLPTLPSREANVKSRCLSVGLVAVVLAVLLASVAWAADPRYIRKSGSNSQVVVFVHGVLGDSTSTWTNGSSYWPDMLTKDKTFDGSDIYVYEYPSTLIRDTFSIDEVAENMRLRFEADGISAYKEIVFLTHSMGGLATRAYLLKYRGVAGRVRLVYFFSTPTTGSEVAELARLISRNPQFGKMKPMQSADYLADLQRTWLAAEFPFPSYCAYEKQSVYGQLIVTQASAASLCNRHLDPIDANHISIVKPVSANDVPYVAFKAAFVAAPRLAQQGGCFASKSLFGNGDNAAQVEEGICPDQADPQRALRIRYVWLDSTSASLLMAGEVVGNLEKSLGARPHVIDNAVAKELRTIITRFGSSPGANKEQYRTTISGQNDSSSVRREDSGPFPRSRKTKLYNGGGPVYLPEASVYQTIIGSLDYPAGFSMYYNQYEGSAGSEQNILDSVTLWRYLSADDIKNYPNNLAKLRDWLAQQRARLGPTIMQSFSFDDFFPKKMPLSLPVELASMQYFARSGWPEDFAFVRGGGGCGAGSFEMTVMSRSLYVQVAVIENGTGKGTLPLVSLTADEIVTDRLRPADQDKAWARSTYDFPIPGLSQDESVVVPLQIELRPMEITIPDQEQMAGAELQYQGIRKYDKAVLTQREGNRVIFRKRKEAFRPPSFPRGINYTYGPRAKLVSAKALGQDIALRQFDPAKVWIAFGSEEGSCPSIYVASADDPRQSYGRILTGARGAANIRTDSLVHEGSAFAVEIAEDEPEATRLQEIRIFRIESSGEETLIYRDADRWIVPGLPLRIETPQLHDAGRIRIEVRGFYRTFPEMIVEVAAHRDADGDPPQ
jgi:pimeloyl-ACP methyl ester carboxylesterase